MTVKLVLRKVPNDSTKSYLFIRITKNRKSTYESLGCKITTKNLKKNGEAVTSLEPNYKQINKKIKERLNYYRNIEGEVKSPYITKRHEVIPFFSKFIQTSKSEGTRRARQSCKNNFQDFLISIDNEKITFEEINKTVIDQFEVWLKRKGLSHNSAIQYIQVLQTVCKAAKEDLQFKDDFNPFRNINLKRKPTENNPLTLDQLKKFARKDWNNDKYNLYRDMFLFQLYGGGLRVSDVLTLRWGNFRVNQEIQISFKQFKTKKTLTINIYNAINFLNQCINRYKPDFIGTINNINKEIDQLLQESKQIEFEIEERLFTEEKEGEMKSLQLTVKRNKIEDLNKKISELYKKYIQDLSNNYPNEFVFPFMWDFKNNKPFINIEKEIHSEEEYKKFDNEKSKYYGILKQMEKKLKLPKLSSHVARHTYTQLLLENNVNIHNLSMALGHSSLRVTETYRRTLENEGSRSVNKLLPNIT